MESLDHIKSGLAQIIREMIEDGYTQKYIAKKLGINPTDISCIVHNKFKNMTVDRLLRLYMKMGYSYIIIVKKKDGDTEDSYVIESDNVYE